MRGLRRAWARRIPLPSPSGLAKPSTPTIRVPRLAAPLPIDGDLESGEGWDLHPDGRHSRDGLGCDRRPPRCQRRHPAGLSRQRALSSGHQLRRRPSFHQPVVRHYQQDGIELCINGFLPGFKFDITRTSDAGPIVIRQRYYYQDLDFLVPPSHAPRTITVLKDARDVPTAG